MVSNHVVRIKAAERVGLRSSAHKREMTWMWVSGRGRFHGSESVLGVGSPMCSAEIVTQILLKLPKNNSHHLRNVKKGD